MDTLVVASCSGISKLNTPLPQQEEKKKVKKVRRKPRATKKKTAAMKPVDEPDFICDETRSPYKIYCCQELALNLRVEPVSKNIPCVFIRKRSTRFRYIKLHTFATTSCVPVVFRSGLNLVQRVSNNVRSIEENFSRIVINDTSVLQTSLPLDYDESTIQKPRRSSRVQLKEATPKSSKQSRKKTVLDKKAKPLKGYISKREAEEGLRNGKLIKGFIRINPRNFREAYVSNENRNIQDYIILTMDDRNGAMEGDEVVLEVKPPSEWKDGKATASVVHILKLVHSRLAIGHLRLMPDKNRFFAELLPRDTRIPRIRIPQICWPQNFYKMPQQYENVLFLAQIVNWEDARFAVGMLKENLGSNGNLKVETEVILKEHSLDVTPYTIEETNVCLKHFDEVNEEEMKYREDLREECVFTIDPASARDLDDAVSCVEIPNGNFKIGVHISDVGFYIENGTVLDEKASKKATTIYLVNETYHMLPLELCLECSLLPGSEKRTFSVFWEMTSDGDILDTYFTRSIINSCTKLAYEHAQMMIENPDCEFPEDEMPFIYNFTQKDISLVVNRLNNIAKVLRKRRFANGALRIDQPKLAFKLNPSDGEPEEWSIYELKDAHRMIEEFMLLANMSVAAKIKEHFPDLALLRCHEPPIQHMLQEAQSSLETAGIFIDISSSGSLQSTLWKYYGDDYLSVSRMAVLNHLFAKTMKRANYFCAANAASDEHFSHYALSVALYTHFTSPIRRYADIMVHRLLAASLGYCDKPNWTSDYVAKIAENCNTQKYNAKKAGDASIDLYLAHYIETHQPFIQTAVVVDVRDKMFEVIVLKTGSVVRVNTSDFDECIKWKSVIIPKLNNEEESGESENGKKMWKIEVTFPPLHSTTEPITLVIERFALVKVALMRKEKTNKLEARLVPPIPTISFSNNGGSTYLYDSASDTDSC